MKRLITFCIISFGMLTASMAAEKQPTDYVNPFIGTTNFGTTNPGAVCPNGMMSVVPFNVMGSEDNKYDKDARWWSTPYEYHNCFFTGYSHVNLSGVGCPELGSLLLMPTTGELSVDYKEYGSRYKDEQASPGYYSNFLTRYNVKTEVTATPRTGVARFTFPAGQSHVLLNLGEGLTNESGAFLRQTGKCEFEGMKLLGTFCYNPQAVFPIYFVMRVNKQPAASGYWKKQRPMTGVEAEWDPDNGRYKLYTGYGKELGTNDRGLVRWNSVTDERMVFSHTADPHSISSDVIVCLLRDSSGRVWAGTFWGGLNCYDGNRFIHYRSRKGDSNSLVYDNVWALAEDADKNIWIGTLGGGLQCLNPQTGIFTTYSTGNSNLVSDYISSLCISCDNNLVIGTSAGMAFMDLRTGEITNFAGTKSGKTRLSNQNINQVYEDSRGLLWIATREGLNVYDSKRDELYEVPIKPGFSKLLILGITEDENKSIWISTGGELINVVLSVDSKTEQPVFRCYTYNDKDGLQSCDFNQRSLKRLHTGEIVVGGLYGLNRFQPGNIKYNRTLPKVMFTGFQLFNEDVKVGKEYAGRVILKEALNETEEVVLDYKQNVFTVLFASDNFVLPEKTQYFYKLEGFNENWLTSMSDMHRVTYTNLAPGTYILKVKATNSDGYAGTEEASLKIVILPPFWMTPWAYIVYALLIVGVVSFSLYAVQRRERNKFRIRQIEEDAKKREELSQMKFRFFTNVSHELRTPLTLIISPMESMMKEITDEKLHGKLQLMYRNAQRLLNLVNQLLDFRKNEMAGLHLTLSEGDIVAYVRSICASFLMLSEKKHVHLTFFSAMESLNMSFDEDKIGKVVMNLLSNAFKFTPDGGRVDVALEMSKEMSGRLLIKVSDTGVGIRDEDKERIFERFYQVEQEEPEHQSTGSGIGLSLVRDFVTLHEGTVRVVDNVGSGSVFLIELPVKHVHVSPSKPAPLAEEVEEHEELLPDMEEEPLPDDLPDDMEEDNEDEKEKPLALIVDDNEDLVAFMKDSLSLYFRIQSASNGREAWQKIPELMPDIIVSDVMMPEMDGNELCRWVKTDKRTSDIPMILLTARQAVEDKVEGLTIGADDYVTKPFNVEILILRMRKLIDLSKKRKAKSLIDPEPSEIAITSLDEKLVENAIKYVEANIGRCDLSVEELSRGLGMSRVHLYKKLLQITGKTPIEFIRVIRLKRAAQMLRESQQNVSEIAYQLGFNNPKYFSKYFKDEFGVLPSVYQEREGR